MTIQIKVNLKIAWFDIKMQLTFQITNEIKYLYLNMNNSRFVRVCYKNLL